jgi:hypothetical protein
MDLTFYIDSDDFDDVKQAALIQLVEWLKDNPRKINLLVEPSGLDLEQEDEIECIEKLGLQLTISRKSQLKQPLQFLYELALSLPCEFAFGAINPKNNKSETICYFGSEEGKPDLVELGTYANLK